MTDTNPASDNIIGTDFNDTLTGSRGNDSIFGLGGNDNIFDSAGDDFIDGGSGSDRIDAQGGVDTILGGDGNDQIFVFDATAMIDGGAGDDLIQSSGGDSTILGGDGDDAIDVTGNVSLIDGGNGVDFVSFNLLPPLGRPLVLQQNDDGTIQFADQQPIILRNIEGVFFFGASDPLDGSALSVGISLIAGVEEVITGSGNDLIRIAAGLTENGLSITTGDGADIIRFEQNLFFSGGLTDVTITDFSAEDLIDLVQIARRFDFGPFMNLPPVFIGADAFTGRGGEFRFERGAEETLLLFDGDGNTEIDFTLTFDGSFDFEQVSVRSIQSFSALRITRSIADQGTDGDDRLLGTFGDDTIQGLGGNDSLEGRGGADILDGGAGDDIFFLDVLNESAGLDVPPATIIGGADMDLVVVDVSQTFDVA
ncbi:MAG: calcium-binding protein, partial [Pseudomonadota bacterium]